MVFSVLPALLYLLAAFAVYPEIFSRVYISLGDEWCHLYSQSFFIKSWLQQGILPFWNPLVLCGIPSNLDSVSFYTLPTLALSFLNVNTAWNAKVFIFTFLAGYLMFRLLARQIKLSWPAAFMGGLLWMAFAVSSSPDHIAVALMPLIFSLTLHWLDIRKFYLALAVSLALSVYFLHSNMQFVLYFFSFLYFFILFYNACVYSKDKNLKHFLNLVLKATFLFIFPAIVCAFHILPTLDLLSQSNRQMVQEHLRILMPFDLIQLFYPNFFLTTLTPELNFLPGRILSEAVAILAGQNRLQMVPPPYAGVLPLLLAGLTLFRKNKETIEKYFMASALFILAYLIFNPLVYTSLLRHIPVINMLWSIGRVEQIYNFSIALLAAISFHHLLRPGKESEWHLDRAKKAGAWIVGVTSGLIVMKGILWVVLNVFEESLLSILSQKILPWIQGQKSYQASPEFYTERLRQLVRFLKSWASFGNLYFLLPTVFLFSGLYLIKCRLEGRLRAGFFVTAGFAVIIIDLGMHFLPARSFTPQELKPLAAEASFLSSQPGIFRVMPLQPDSDRENPILIDKRSLDTRTVVMRPETNSLYGLATPEGYRALFPRRYAKFIELLTGEPPRGWLAGEYESVEEEIADLVNIKYFIAPQGKKFQGDHYQLVYENEKHRIYENKDVLPRAFLVHRIRVRDNEETIYSEIKNKEFRFSEEAVVERTKMPPGDYTVGTPSSGNHLQVNLYSPNRIQIEAETKNGAYLVFTDSHLKHWKAYLDGDEVAIETTNYIFRGLELPAGSHKIEFSYNPQPFFQGLSISVLSLGLSLALAWIFRRRNF